MNKLKTGIAVALTAVLVIAGAGFVFAEEDAVEDFLSTLTPVTSSEESNIAEGAQERMNSLLDSMKKDNSTSGTSATPQEVYLEDVYTPDMLSTTQEFTRNQAGYSRIYLQVDKNTYITIYDYNLGGMTYDKETIHDQMEQEFYNRLEEQKADLENFRNTAAAMGVTHPEDISFMYIYLDDQGTIMYEQTVGGAEGKQVDFSSDDWKDMELSINGVVVSVPTSYAEFAHSTGYIFENEADAGSVLNPGFQGNCMLGKEGMSSIKVALMNKNETEDVYTACTITEVQCDLTQSADAALNIRMINGIQNASTLDEVKTAIGEEPLSENTLDDGSVELVYQCDDVPEHGQIILTFRDKQLTGVTMKRTEKPEREIGIMQDAPSDAMPAEVQSSLEDILRPKK